jgi:hypothetical protein
MTKPIIILSQLNRRSKNDNHSYSQADNHNASGICKKSKQLNLWEFPKKPAVETAPYLQIRSIAVEERVNPKEIRDALWIYPHAVRACGGQYSADEAHKICRAVKSWDWVLDENNRPYCLPQLEALIDSIIKRSVGGVA